MIWWSDLEWSLGIHQEYNPREKWQTCSLWWFWKSNVWEIIFFNLFFDENNLNVICNQISEWNGWVSGGFSNLEQKLIWSYSDTSDLLLTDINNNHKLILSCLFFHCLLYRHNLTFWVSTICAFLIFSGTNYLMLTS